VNHPLFARMYLRMASRRLDGEERDHRRALLEGLSGEVIEVGAGSGINFRFYPRTVSHVLAVEPEPVLRNAAVDNAAHAPVPVSVVSGVSGALPGEAETFDAGVASLVLCSVPDPGRALAELFRVIRPGGELRFYEHVVARGRASALIQRIADATLWPRLAGGCHLSRDTGAAFERAGFTVESCERFTFSPGAPVPAIPHILGCARRP
jgi:SAM-dependent methyltransferase